MVSSRPFLQGYDVSDSGGVLYIKINYGLNPVYTHIVFNGCLDRTRSSLIYGRRQSITSYISERIKSEAPVVMDIGQVTSLDTSGLALMFDVTKNSRVSRIFIVHPKLDIEHQLQIAACSVPEIARRFPIREHLTDFFKDIYSEPNIFIP